MKKHTDNYVRILSYAFVACISIFLLAGTLTWYILQQLENAVEVSINDTLPEAMIAMHLSDSSAKLLVTAPKLLTADSPSQTKIIAANLDYLNHDIIDTVAELESFSYSQHHNHYPVRIRVIANSLVRNLIQLKELSDTKNRLKRQFSQTLQKTRRVNNALMDIIDPIIQEAVSLSHLSAERLSQQNKNIFFELQNKQLTYLYLLFEVKTLVLTIRFNHHDQSAQSVPELKQHLKRLSGLNLPPNDRFINFLKTLISGIEQKKAVPSLEDLSQINDLIRRHKDHISTQLSNTHHLADIGINELVAEAEKDMAFALDIKGEGNLIFALLNALSDVSDKEKITQLRQRFNTSYQTFHQAAQFFLKNTLTTQNPNLGQNLNEIDQQINQVGKDSENLFKIRMQMIQNSDHINIILASNQNYIEQLKSEIRLLLLHIKDDSDQLSHRLDTIRTYHNKLLLMVDILLLIVTGLIAFFIIRKFGRHEQELNQAATVFNNTAEGIVITDPNSTIIAVNKAFSEISGYSEREVIGKNIRILKSGRHRRAFYEDMWQSLSNTGRWQGEIFNRRKNGQIYPEWLTINGIRDHNQDISQYVAIFSDISLLKKSLAEMDHLANHDCLTGLPNRLLFNDRLKHAVIRAQRDKQKIAVFFLDLDGFKTINDNYGHKAGDELLCQVSKRLLTPLREADTVARLGGDEFTIIMENFTNKDDVATTATKILELFDRPFHIQSHHFSISTSIGISLYPQDGNSVERLVENADMAMYLAKHTGKNNFQFYRADLKICEPK